MSPTRPSAAFESLEWSDLRILLAICRAGSLAGAARLLGKDHSTLFRKLNRIEDQAGVRFFERLPSGYTMTDAGEVALEFGERIEGEFHALSREIDGRDARLQGSVRVTAPDGVCAIYLPRILAAFHRMHPEVAIELLAGSAAFDLSRREADIAIRATRRPPDDSLGKRISAFRFAAYASPAYLSRVGERALGDYDWITLAGYESWLIPRVWKNQREMFERRVMHTNQPAAALQAAEEGIGVTMMSCYLGDHMPGLVRVGSCLDEHDMELWIVTHPVLRHTARVRVLMTFLTDAFAAKADVFAGLKPRPR